LLQQQSLEHGQGGIAWRAHRAAPQRPQQLLHHRPIHQSIDPLQCRVPARHIGNQPVGKAHLPKGAFRHPESSGDPSLERITDRNLCKALAFADDDGRFLPWKMRRNPEFSVKS
jgi:hypothetical protein